jgi:hypothetical protein
MLYHQSPMLNERCDSAFKKRVLLKCYDALEAVGYSRHRKAEVDWPLAGGFHGWVGLNTGLHKDRLNINPFVGIHSMPIHKLWYRLAGQSYPGRYGRTATYALHMGELDGAKDEPAFAFSPVQSEGFIDSEIERLAALYATVGMDYARSIASYDALLPLFAEMLGRLGGYPEKYACCLYLMGRKAEAQTYIKEFTSPALPDYFEGFAEPFLKMLDTEAETG